MSGYKIPILASIGRAYRSVFGHLRLAASFAWRPLVIILLIELVGPALLLGRNRLLLLALVPTIGFLFFGSIFIVRWYRFVLISDSDNSGLFPLGWRPFLVVCLQLALLFLASIVIQIVNLAIATHNLFALSPETIRPLPPIIVLASTIWFVIALFLGFRVCLVFPAAAIERPIGFGTAWNLLAGNYWRLLLCAIACYLPFHIAGSVAEGMGIFVDWRSTVLFIVGGGRSPGWVLSRALSLAIAFAGVGVVAALLSNAYREITGEGRDGIGGAFD